MRSWLPQLTESLEKVANGMSTRVRACMINRWRAKIDWKDIYNMRDPLRMGDRKSRGREKKGEYGNNFYDLGNLRDLALKKEEEH